MSAATVRPALRPTGIPVFRCRVDAAGVPAQWIETTAAWAGQQTLVHFLEPTEVVRRSRSEQFAAQLAASTGARVLRVAYRSAYPSHTALVEDGLTAWAWLQHEGCDLHSTAFVVNARADAVRNELLERGLAISAVDIAEFILTDPSMRGGPHTGLG